MTAVAAAAGTASFILACLLVLLGVAGLLLRLTFPPAVWQPGPFLSQAQRPG
jgi:hypothetical protein